MSGKEIDEAVTTYRREVLKYKQDVRTAKNKLDKLATDYAYSNVPISQHMCHL